MNATTLPLLLMSLLIVAFIAVVADGQIYADCTDYPLTPGETLDNDCNVLCSPNDYNVTDYNRVDVETNIVYRIINCNCTASNVEDEFRCTSRRQVFDMKNHYTDSCSEFDPNIGKASGTDDGMDSTFDGNSTTSIGATLGINSTSQCESYCKNINPVAFESAQGQGEASFCNCGLDLSTGQKIKVCGKSGGPGTGIGLGIIGSKSITSTTIVVTILLVTSYLVVGK